MEQLLKHDFTIQFNLPISTVNNISAQTLESYFELKDDIILIHTTVNDGVAKYKNINLKTINIINYEVFFNSLANTFIHGKEKCDLIVYDNNKEYFLLNELTDTLPKYVISHINTQGSQIGKKQKAISQLLSSLIILLQVPAIQRFINTHTNKHCCFFNKQSMAPPTLTATTAFNRLSKLVSDGLKMPNYDMEALGFEFWEYSGNQVYNL